MNERRVVAASPSDRPRFYREPSFGQRVGARLIDGAVLVPLSLVIGLLADDQAQALLGIGAVAAYEVVLVAVVGQTVGKMLTRTQVVDCLSGAVPTWMQAGRRWFTVIVVALIAVLFDEPVVATLGAVWTLVVLLPVLRPPLHRGLHDTAARTIVTVVDRHR